MKERKSKVNWEDYPKIEKCTDMGDTNGNKMDIEVKEEKTYNTDTGGVCFGERVRRRIRQKSRTGNRCGIRKR